MCKPIYLSAMILILTSCSNNATLAYRPAVTPAIDPVIVKTCDQLPLPVVPLLPKIAPEDLKLLTDSAYERLAITRSLLRNYAVQLRSVIELHNQQCAK